MTEKQIAERNEIYKAQSYSTRKSLIILALICIAWYCSSCSSRYAIDKYGSGGCGAWYPKKCKIGTKNW